MAQETSRAVEHQIIRAVHHCVSYWQCVFTAVDTLFPVTSWTLSTTAEVPVMTHIYWLATKVVCELRTSREVALCLQASLLRHKADRHRRHAVCKVSGSL